MEKLQAQADGISEELITVERALKRIPKTEADRRYLAHTAADYDKEIVDQDERLRRLEKSRGTLSTILATLINRAPADERKIQEHIDSLVKERDEITKATSGESRAQEARWRKKELEKQLEELHAEQAVYERIINRASS